MDHSKIEGKFIKENQLLGLGFPKQGYIFYRITGIEDVEYKYDESPGSIAADTQEDSARLPMSAYSIDNLLEVEDCDHIFQVFMGWRPGAVRQYLYYPFDTARRNLDVKTIYTKSPFGYITGFDSPYDSPSPKTEIFIPKALDVGFAWWNPLSSAETVEQNILIRKLETDIIRDVDLIDLILKGKQPCRLTTVGGVGSSMEYRAKNILDVDFVQLGNDREKIAAAVSIR